MSDEQRTTYDPQAGLITIILVLVTVGTIVFTGVIVVMQASFEVARQRSASLNLKARRLRYKANDVEVEPKELANDGGFHVFLSHVWSTGQDSMRVVKQRLLEMMPEIRVFLDVDDLEDIGALDKYVEVTSCVLVFCTQGYFESKNCMIELRSAVSMHKRILPLMDTDPSKGGLTRREIESQLHHAEEHLFEKWGFQGGPLARELLTALFTAEPIEWNRIGVRSRPRALRSREPHVGAHSCASQTLTIVDACGALVLSCSRYAGVPGRHPAPHRHSGTPRRVSANLCERRDRAQARSGPTSVGRSHVPSLRLAAQCGRAEARRRVSSLHGGGRGPCSQADGVGRRVAGTDSSRCLWCGASALPVVQKPSFGTQRRSGEPGAHGPVRCLWRGEPTPRRKF
jgi:hypothetical protein